MHSRENISSRCKIKKISEISKDKLFKFYQKIYPFRYKTLTENWKWWYRFDKNFAEPIILELEDKVIGQAAFLKNNIIIDDKKFPAIWFQDYAVLPEFIGMGLGKLLTKEWMKICPNQMAICSPYSFQVLKKFGWNFDFNTERLIRPLNYFKFIPILNKFNFNFLNAFPKFLIKNKFKDKTKIKPYNIDKNFNIISDSFEIKNSKILIKDLPRIDRDKNWLHWRIMECPYRKDIYFFEYENSFSLVHIYFTNKVKRMNILLNYSTENKSENKLNKLIINWALENNIDFIWAIHNDKTLNKFFPRIFNRPLKLATWSSSKLIMNGLKKGFDDLQGADSDIESSFYLE